MLDRITGTGIFGIRPAAQQLMIRGPVPATCSAPDPDQDGRDVEYGLVADGEFVRPQGQAAEF